MQRTIFTLDRHGHPAAPVLRWVTPLLGQIVLAGLVLLYRYDSTAYSSLLTVEMMRPYVTPFIDAAQIPTLIGCWQHGIDVYVTAPCDPLNRAMAYSPLWLRASFLPTDLAWLNALGLALDSAFFLSLALLPVPRRWPGFVFWVLAVFSSLPVFALERGNMDVVIFVQVAVGGWLCCRRPPVQLAGYSVITLAGLLKFYPLVLFLLFLRERIAVFIALCAAACIVLIGFVAYFRVELIEMARNLPSVGYYKDSFGMRQFPFGLGTVLQALIERSGLPDTSILRLVAPPYSGLFMLEALFLFIMAALAIAFRLAGQLEFRSAVSDLAIEERIFLVIGAALICGCFFAAQNQSYRGIDFLFVMPGIVTLATAPVANAVRTLFRVTTGLTLALLWGLSLQQLVAWLSGGTDSPMGGSVAMYLYWIAHELAWWWVISVLLGVLFCFVSTSPVWQDLFRFQRRAS